MDNAVAICQPDQQELAPNEYHVASFVAHVIAEEITSFTGEVEAEVGTEVHAIGEDGKVVFTIEAATQGHIGQMIDRLKLHTGLYSLSPVYHQFLTEE